MEKELQEKETMQKVMEQSDKELVEPKKYAKRQQKKKVCAFCVDGAKEIDYKDVAKLKRYMTEKGKIIPARQSNLCAKHQREVAKQVKLARFMGFIPFCK